MFVQILIGSGLMLLSILFAGFSLWAMEAFLRRRHNWLVREPHTPKLLVLLCIVAVWILFIITGGVWIWSFAFLSLGLFPTLEESVYFSLVTFTTLGFGDIVLGPQWRILSGMAAANGLLNFGLLTAILVETLRHVRLGQSENSRKH